MINGMRERLTGGINEAFPHKICINLDRRPDRWREMQQKFDGHGIHSVRRFPALDGEKLVVPSDWVHTSGAYGCLLSHVQVVEEARRLGLSSVLVFEDDAVFDHHLERKFRTYIKQLPRDWNMLFFGALHKDEPIRISDNIARITKANSTYAYALKDSVFDAFIELNRKAETVIDNNSFILQQQFNCYCFTPHLAWVESGYSDAQKRLENHWYLQKSLVLFGTPVDRLLSDTTVVFAHRDQTGSGRAAENLKFLVHYYNEFFSPHIEIMIVEQGASSTLNPATLPPNCRYFFEENEDSFNRERCFDTGIKNSSRKFVILSDNDIYLETLDIRANLRMCEEYDCATGFSKIIDLTNEDSVQLRSTSTTRGIDITKSVLGQSNEREGYCLFGKREALQIPGRSCEGGSAKAETHLGLPAKRQALVFQSPNHALRLQS